MGQKVNALSLRLGINRKWNSKWFLDHQYAKKVHEDLAIQKYLFEVYAKESVLISRWFVKRSLTTTFIFLHIYAPTTFTVLEGSEQTELIRKSLEKIVNGQVEFYLVNVFSISKPFTKTLQKASRNLSTFQTRKYFVEGLDLLNAVTLVRSATLLSHFIAKQLEINPRHNQFLDFIRKGLNFFLQVRPDIKGIRVQVKGRLNGAERSKKTWFIEGQIPLHTLREHIDYGKSTAFTSYGVCGVKVWVCYQPTHFVNNRDGFQKSGWVISDLIPSDRLRAV